MRKPVWQWVVAVVLTLVSAVWQRLSGPTYPVRGKVSLGGEEVRLKLTRTHAGPGDQPVRIAGVGAKVMGSVAWRRYPTNDEWRLLTLTRDGNALEGALPHQPPAGKLEYQVRLTQGAESASFPGRPAVTRFKGDVPAAVLVPHVLAMFTGMLVSSAAGLRAILGGDGLRRLTWSALAILGVGGLILGPVVQKAAFGEYWTGVPFGWDLTDNKTLIVAVAWAVAALAVRGGRSGRPVVAAAALATLVVFAIPHSVWGSQINWEEARPAGKG